jgi:hypothetical protein
VQNALDDLNSSKMDSDDDKYTESIELVSVEEAERQSFLHHHVEGEDDLPSSSHDDVEQSAPSVNDENDENLPVSSSPSTSSSAPRNARNQKRAQRNRPRPRFVKISNHFYG